MANINISEYENKLSCMIGNQTKENICSFLSAEIKYNIKITANKGNN
jgi:hypothetical protein